MQNRLRLSAVTAAAGMLLVGCGSAPDPAEDNKSTDEYPNSIEQSDDFDPNAHLEVAFTSMPPTWDPTQSITNGDYRFYTAVYDRLLMEDHDGSIVPMLATSFEPSEDNLSMTLTLREGLQFSDGTPFDAEAVKFNLERAAGPDSRINGEVNMITSVEVIDPLTVKVNVGGGVGTLAVALSSRPGIMVSPAAVQAGTLGAAPTGIGPYVTTTISPGDRANMEKTPNYWDPDAQKAATATYRIMTDDQTRYNALLSGEIDVALLNPDQLETAINGGLNVVVEPSALFLYFGVNTAKAPFDNPEVRKALNMAIDRQGISEGLYDGHCTPQVQLYPEGSPGYSEKLGDGSEVFPYDPEQAKQILEDAGVTNLQITSVLPPPTIYVQLAEVIQSQLQEVGIEMTVKPVPNSQLVQEFSLDKTVEAVTSVATVLNDPGAVHGRYLIPSALFNPGGEEYTELNEVANEAALPLDPAERKPIYEKYWDVWVETPPHMIPICMLHAAAAARDNVAGVYQLPSGQTDLRYASIANE